MARQPRLVVPGLALHIVQRGNNRTRCFTSDEDFLVYLALMRRIAPAAKCAVHAYCLMPNHVHILLTPSAHSSAGAFMHEASFRYSQYFNKKYGRTGTLWEGRYRSCVVASAVYVLACHRYIELNPVRAKLVSTPAEYAWSSFRINAGASLDSLVTRHEKLVALSNAEYSQMVMSGLEQALMRELQSSTKGGYPLASDEIKAALMRSSRRKLAPGRPGPKPKPAQDGVTSDLLE